LFSANFTAKVSKMARSLGYQQATNTNSENNLEIRLQLLLTTCIMNTHHY
jgi:hypothetical protein